MLEFSPEAHKLPLPRMRSRNVAEIAADATKRQMRVTAEGQLSVAGGGKCPVTTRRG